MAAKASREAGGLRGLAPAALTGGCLSGRQDLASAPGRLSLPERGAGRVLPRHTHPHRASSL